MSFSKSLVLACAIVLVLGWSALHGQLSKTADAEVVEAEAKFGQMRSTGDMKLAESIFAEEFNRIGTDGRVTTRAQEFGTITPNVGVRGNATGVTDLQVRVYGDTAVTRGIARSLRDHEPHPPTIGG